MDLFAWIDAHLQPIPCTSDIFIYNDQESQSGRSLPILYQPFDGAQKLHWQERGAIFDFLYAVRGEGGRLLDFGPGDGWPSLLVAPDAAEVVGVDASPRRVAVCSENARRLGIGNARFVQVPAGERFPFDDGSFDGAMAASSVEQAPDPYKALSELYRVLKPGGRLRLRYESLNRYIGRQERDMVWERLAGGRSGLILFDRRPAAEQATQVILVFDAPLEALWGRLGAPGGALRIANLTPAAINKLRPALCEARICTTRHPSGPTLAAWLAKIGFRDVRPTCGGGQFAGELFDRLPPAKRPAGQAGVDALLRPAVRTAVKIPAPLEDDPAITAVK